MATVTLRDETATGRALATTTLDDLPNLLTARELVRLRVRSGQPVDRARPVDWERQADVAEAAFARNGFVLLVGERQIESLDEVVDLSGDPVISFVRLIALMGG